MLTLQQAVTPLPEKVLNPQALGGAGVVDGAALAMVLLAAGKGTRFGQAPKCAQLVDGAPLARYSIDAFKSFSGGAPVVCVVGYRFEEVTAALGQDSIYVRSDNPAGGTAFAAYEAFSVPGLENANPLLIVTMGDRIVPASILRRLREAHVAGDREADLTFLTAIYEPPANRGKGRVIRDAAGRVLGIVEQRDIDAIGESKLRQPLDALTEGNCPLYAVRARLFRRHLERLSNANAQQQYYLTDIIESIHREGGEIRTVRTAAGDAEYDLLCSDVTRPMDLALLEGALRASKPLMSAVPACVWAAARAIAADRPPGQTASIRRQLEELLQSAGPLQFKHGEPVAIGIAGGRLRIAFMHPDMGRFLGPAWQMPIGAGNADGREQIVALAQSADDCRIHLSPTRADFQEKIGFVDANNECMYPGEEVTDWYSYENFGTRMAENLLLSLGYFSDEELRRRRELGLPEPPASLWISTSMRRPFSLVGNAIASLRTLRAGNLGQKVQAALGKGRFQGLKILLTGNIPRGGFSSSSAVTVATKNALNSLYDLGVSPELLVHLSCQAEYGTGVRAGSLDQATEQMGRSGQGTLLSSNPRDNYRTLGAYPVPTHRFQVLFPYSVDRDREAWKWSAGAYAPNAESEGQTAAEMRKLTGKSAEMAALLLRLPLDQDFFQRIEPDLLALGQLGPESLRWVHDALASLPLLVAADDLRRQLQDARGWFIDQAMEIEKLSPASAAEKFDATLQSLFAGWRDPRLPRRGTDGVVRREVGVPLRAMVRLSLRRGGQEHLLDPPPRGVDPLGHPLAVGRPLLHSRSEVVARRQCHADGHGLGEGRGRPDAHGALARTLRRAAF